MFNETLRKSVQKIEIAKKNTLLHSFVNSNQLSIKLEDSANQF